MYKKFEKDDLIYNVLIANPKVKFTIFKGNIYDKFSVSAQSEAPTEIVYALDFSQEENSMYIPLV